MMRSLFSGVSGIKSHQTKMDVIGNNIANVNTTGFKASRTIFADMLSQTLSAPSAPGDNIGGTNAKQIGLGVSVSSIDMIFTDASVQSTGKNTDLALSGSGLFVVKQGLQTFYTRDGAFEFDADGNYVLPGSGLYVQGWNAVDGMLNTNSATENINVQMGKSMDAQATGMISYSYNLNSEMPLIATITGGTLSTYGRVVASSTNPVTLTFGDGSIQTVTSGSYVTGHSMPITTVTTVYDTLGGDHSIPVLLEMIKKDSMSGNQWSCSLAPTEHDDGAGNKYYSTSVKEPDGTTVTPSMASGSIILQFTTSGRLNMAASTMSNPAITITYASSPNGALTGQTVALDFASNGGVTQYASQSTVNPSSDGNASGSLTSISIDSTGVITGSYTNGLLRTEAQVAVAQFTNMAGLTKYGNSLYQESMNSGTPNIKTSTALGVTITPSALEMSGTDLTEEFASMITTQRGFQSNTKIITTGDEMLETVINMKR